MKVIPSYQYPKAIEISKKVCTLSFLTTISFLACTTLSALIMIVDKEKGKFVCMVLGATTFLTGVVLAVSLVFHVFIKFFKTDQSFCNALTERLFSPCTTAYSEKDLYNSLT